VGVVQQPVKDRISKRWIAYGVMPLFHWNLTGNQGRSDAMSVFH
jgi:hypothetical protein